MRPWTSDGVVRIPGLEERRMARSARSEALESSWDVLHGTVPVAGDNEGGAVAIHIPMTGADAAIHSRQGGRA